MRQVGAGVLLGGAHVQHQHLAGRRLLEDGPAIQALEIVAVRDEVCQRHLQFDQPLFIL